MCISLCRCVCADAKSTQRPVDAARRTDQVHSNSEWSDPDVKSETEANEADSLEETISEYVVEEPDKKPEDDFGYDEKMTATRFEFLVSPPQVHHRSTSPTQPDADEGMS